MKLEMSILAVLATAVLASPPFRGANSEKNNPSLDSLIRASPMPGVSFQRVKAMGDPTPDRPAVYFQGLHRVAGDFAGHSAASALSALSKHAREESTTPYSNITALTEWSTQYATTLDWDGTKVSLIVDTGSSDTWTVAKGFHCLTRSGATFPEEACQFGDERIDGFKYGPDEQLHFSVRYGSGEYVTGPLGLADLTAAGITIVNQTVGLANRTFFFGNNVTTGILGLGFQPLTSAYYGNSTESRPQFQTTYSPFFTTMANQADIENKFAIAISRHSSEGIIAWGGMPPVDVNEMYAVSTDLLVVSLDDVFDM